MKALGKCTMSLKYYLLSVLGLFWPAIHMSVSMPDEVEKFPIECPFSLVCWVVFSSEAILPSTMPNSGWDLGACTELSQIPSVKREQIIPSNIPGPSTKQTCKHFQGQFLNVSLYSCLFMTSCPSLPNIKPDFTILEKRLKFFMQSIHVLQLYV